MVQVHRSRSDIPEGIQSKSVVYYSWSYLWNWKERIKWEIVSITSSPSQINLDQSNLTRGIHYKAWLKRSHRKETVSHIVITMVSDAKKELKRRHRGKTVSKIALTMVSDSKTRLKRRHREKTMSHVALIIVSEAKTGLKRRHRKETVSHVAISIVRDAKAGLKQRHREKTMSQVVLTMVSDTKAGLKRRNRETVSQVAPLTMDSEYFFHNTFPYKVYSIQSKFLCKVFSIFERFPLHSLFISSELTKL